MYGGRTARDNGQIVRIRKRWDDRVRPGAKPLGEKALDVGQNVPGQAGLDIGWVTPVYTDHDHGPMREGVCPVVQGHCLRVSILLLFWHTPLSTPPDRGTAFWSIPYSSPLSEKGLPLVLVHSIRVREETAVLVAGDSRSL